MSSGRRLWTWLGVVFALSFAALAWMGREIYLAAPPIPSAVLAPGGHVVFTGEQIRHGQQLWLSVGGQQLGSVWGHGSYVAPDWSADWLHREALALRARLAGPTGWDALETGERGAVAARLEAEMRRNTWAPEADTVTLGAERAAAVDAVAAHYDALFGDDASLDALRDDYAMQRGLLADPAERRALSAFFWWSAWSAATDRPGEDGLSYTSNWPHEPLVGNVMATSAALWSTASVILLLAGIAAMVWLHSARGESDDPPVPAADPLAGARATPSMRATRKYFVAVAGLFLAQIGLGAITAHYAVEGQAFFGLPLAELLPYTVSRTIHTQFGIFWIATAWLATGLYVAPLLSGHEPKLQKLGVDVLFWALIAIVVGSTATGWLGTMQHRGVDFAFWIGNQGLEFTSMGRVWQVLLFVGLMLWLVLMGRALWPALRRPSESRGLIAMVFLSAACIGLFYASSLTWGQRTHYAMVEYFRWWLVHLWVEGFFEVFATAVIALIFTRLGLVRTGTANRAIVAETIVFLFGGILGTLHHLYFTGTPTSVIAVGSVFSALEVVPLALLGIEGWHNWKRMNAAPWLASYRWALACFVSVAFWNAVGAGLLGFAINPPAALYYVQGLNMTAAHGHAALFGVYGMLGIGLTLFCLRSLLGAQPYADRLLRPAVWGLNLGLGMMVFGSLLPAGIYQAWASVSQGLWYARSAEVIHGPVMETLVWMRVPGDVVFAVGGALLAAHVLRTVLGRRQTAPAAAPGAVRAG